MRAKLMRAFLAAAPLAAGVALTGIAAAPTSDPREKGLEIARKADRRDAGFEDSIVRLRMILRNRNGNESRRVMRIFTLEVAARDEGDKSLILFDKPPDIDGTALLTHANILEPDDQWIYLPALGRVKRISAANKSGPFVGSEFAYEDMGAPEVAKYDHEWLRDEPCPGHEALTCFVLARYPKYPHSGYSRQVVWIDQQEYRLFKSDYYDRRGALLKTLVASRYHQYQDRYWRPHVLSMSNHQTGKSTRLMMSEYQFGTGLGENLFDKNNIDRIK